MYDSEYHHDYYLKNKDRIKQRTKELKWCDCCFKHYRKHYWSIHVKSKKHQERSELKAI